VAGRVSRVGAGLFLGHCKARKKFHMNARQKGNIPGWDGLRTDTWSLGGCSLVWLDMGVLMGTVYMGIGSGTWA
jgi:hypothetical protein